MDTRAISAVFLKVTGLVLVAWCFVQLPSYFPIRMPGESWSASNAAIAALLTLGPALVLGAALWFFPGTITNKIVVVGESSPQDPNTIVLLAVVIVGLFLIAHGTVDLVYHVATFVRLKSIDEALPFAPPTIFAGTVAAIVEAAMGVGLVVGRRGIAQLVLRMRG